MDFPISKDMETGAYLVTLVGLIDTRPIIETVTRLVTRDDWQDGSHLIVDHRSSDILRLTGVDLARMAGFFRDHRSRFAGSRIALLMREPTQFRMGQLWQAPQSPEAPFETRIFLVPAEARRWVGDGLKAYRQGEG